MEVFQIGVLQRISDTDPLVGVETEHLLHEVHGLLGTLALELLLAHERTLAHALQQGLRQGRVHRLNVLLGRLPDHADHLFNLIQGGCAREDRLSYNKFA